ncbi:MAG: c-type cytochrome [Pseudomonadales bacterium]|nr:c-type cytochrome [Pseudomonadales bacterium]MCP5182651.1 c-type cytochrome [Pseudomonadales bacterium]
MGRKTGWTPLLLATAVSLSGCSRASEEFVLPPGDADRGRTAFVDLGCNACHSVQDEFRKLTPELGGDDVIEVVLGGPVSRVKTYGDLVTSIINPSHRLSRGKHADTVNPDGTSRMPYYNDVMTVQELVDLTTYLQGTYSVVIPDYNPYYPH